MMMMIDDEKNIDKLKKKDYKSKSRDLKRMVLVHVMLDRYNFHICCH